MLPRVLAIDDETVRVLDDLLVAVAGNIPHDDLVTLADALASYYSVLHGSPAHVRERRLVADDLGDCARDEARIIAELLQLIRILVHEPKPPGDRVARRIVAADDQEDKIAEELARLHISGCRRVG